MSANSQNVVEVIRKKGSRTYQQKKASAEKTKEMHERIQKIKDEVAEKVSEVANYYGV